MNLLSKYKFVDDCKDISDQIIELVNFPEDIQTVKKQLFTTIGTLTIKDMLESLPTDTQSNLKPLIANLDILELNTKFLNLFTEDQLRTLYIKNFKTIINKMFAEASFDGIRDQLAQLLNRI